MKLLALGLSLGLLLSACARPHATPPTPSGGTRIVLVAPSTAANLVALGAAGSIAGVSDYCSDPALQDLPRVGGLADPNLERVAQLSPTLVLVQGRTPSLEKYCKQANIPYHAFHTDTIAEWKEEVRWLGEQLGRSAQAEELIASLEQGFADLAEARTQNPQQTVPSVLLVASRRPGEAAGILAVGPGGFLDELLRAAGGRNVLEESSRTYVDLAEESLLLLQPDIILELQSPDQDPLATWQRDFPSLPAVQSNKVLALEGEDLLMPGPGMGMVAAAIAQLLSE